MTWPVDDWWEPAPYEVSDGTTLAVRFTPGQQRPVLLVHGLASNALLWCEVADQLAAAGHAVAAVDLRGHGRSSRPDDGYDTPQAARDVTRLRDLLGWRDRLPVVVGQSWGGNVVMRAAAQDSMWGGVLCVDGGWIHLAGRFPTFDECWAALTPPGFGDATPDQVLDLLRTHLRGWPPQSLGAVAGSLEVVAGRVRNRLSLDRHRSILCSLWSHDPRADYPSVRCPVHLMVAGTDSSADVAEALSLLAGATVSWHPQAHHDIHLQHPDLVVEQLRLLIERVQGSAR